MGLGGSKTNKKIETVGRSLTELEKKNIEARLEIYEGQNIETITIENLYVIEG